MEGWLYESDGIYFDVSCSDWGLSPDFSIELFERDDEHPYIVTAEDIENGRYPNYHGKVGDVLYDYNNVDEDST